MRATCIRTGVTTSYTLELLSTRDNGETDRVADTFTINFISPLSMKIEKDRLVTQFDMNGNLEALNVQRGIRIIDEKTGGVVLKFDGGINPNNYMLTADDIKWSFDMVEDYGGRIDVDADGNLVYNKNVGWALTNPVTIHVKVTATIEGIVILSETVPVTINGNELD